MSVHHHIISSSCCPVSDNILYVYPYTRYNVYGYRVLTPGPALLLLDMRWSTLQKCVTRSRQYFDCCVIWRLGLITPTQSENGTTVQKL